MSLSFHNMRRRKARQKAKEITPKLEKKQDEPPKKPKK